MKIKKFVLFLIVSLFLTASINASLAKEDAVQLTSEDTEEGSPAWNPDGTKIAYTIKDENGISIWVMNSEGTNKKKLTSGNYPDWSPDGKKIVYYSKGVWVMNSDGSDQIFFDKIGGSSPDWSPDGTKIALSNGDIWITDSDGANYQKITSNTKDESWPDWSPDGTQIAYVIFHGEIGDNDIWVMNSDGSNQMELITLKKNGANQPAWSPDGTKIALVSGLGIFSGNIVVANADGTNLKEITKKKDNVRDSYPAWSPDGTKIAFKRTDWNDPEHIKTDIFITPVTSDTSSTSTPGFGVIFAVISLFFIAKVKEFTECD